MKMLKIDLNTCGYVLRIFTCLFVFSFSISYTLASAQTCRRISPCKCRFLNGSIIDLSSVGNQNKARWENVVPLPPEKENYTYYYNPCFAFKVGKEGSGCYDGVAVCQKDKITGDFYDCGQQETMIFIWNDATKHINLIYSALKRITNVTLQCLESAYEPILEVKGENATNLYEMTLTSRCACPDLCRENHLSPGSVLVIIFLTFLSLYLLLGIVHSSLTRGAHGWELLPHHEFWADFPLLVRDGFVFVISGCKPETAYERI